MSISAIIRDGANRVSSSTYKPGFMVETDVSKAYSKVVLKLEIEDGLTRRLEGKLPEALDEFFNSWSFKTDNKLIPEELARCGCANDHRTLFLTAVRLLEKALARIGYRVEVEFL